MIVYSKPIYGFALPAVRRLLPPALVRLPRASSPPLDRSFDSVRLPLLKRKTEQSVKTVKAECGVNEPSQLRSFKGPMPCPNRRQASIQGSRAKPTSRRVRSLKAPLRQHKSLGSEALTVLLKVCPVVSDYLSPIASCEHLPFCPPPQHLLSKSPPKTPSLPAKPVLMRLWAFVQEDL
jgi:hypothetical protein